MNIVIDMGMVNIDDENICYANIKDMYKQGNGSGLQIAEHLEPKEDEIQSTCDQISALLYKLEDLIK